MVHRGDEGSCGRFRSCRTGIRIWEEFKLDRIVLKNIRFGSFMKIAILLSLTMGILMGIFIFIAGLLGGNVRASIGTSVLTGLAGGIASLFVGPFVFTLMGAFTALVSYLPFKLILKVFNGLSISGTFEGFCAEDINESQGQESSTD